VAAEALRALPVLARPQRLQLGVQRRQLARQPWITERLLDEFGQLGALLGAHRIKHPLRRGGPGGQRVDQFLDVAGALGEEIPVSAHEFVEALRSISIASSVASEQIIEIR
jgi:hypothetical protein